MKNLFSVLCMFFLSSSAFAQGPFSPAADSIGSNAIHKDSNIIFSWVSNCSVTRGLQNITNISGPFANVGDETFVSGKADGSVVSLGDGGYAIIALNNPLVNHDGYDFAVFENGFYDVVNSGYFLELAFVEISSNGVDFFRFPNESLTPIEIQTSTFETTDPTQINGFAGNFKASYGTPFDLQFMDTVLGIDINNITHLKIIDVVGTIDSAYASYDSYGRIINDPYPTDFGPGGFDLDAVALIDSSLVNSVFSLPILRVKMYPNPAENTLNFTGNVNFSMVSIHNVLGILELQEPIIQNQLDVSALLPGVYILNIQSKMGVYSTKFLKL